MNLFLIQKSQTGTYCLDRLHNYAGCGGDPGFRTQQDFGRVAVTDAYYLNANGISIRAKLFMPVGASRENPLPGVVYIHGYQNNGRRGDAYAIEIARRGMVVLNIDAIGRGHSDIPGNPDAADFDKTYGGRSSKHNISALCLLWTHCGWASWGTVSGRDGISCSHQGSCASGSGSHWLCLYAGGNTDNAEEYAYDHRQIR